MCAITCSLGFARLARQAPLAATTRLETPARCRVSGFNVGQQPGRFSTRPNVPALLCQTASRGLGSGVQCRECVLPCQIAPLPRRATGDAMPLAGGCQASSTPLSNLRLKSRLKPAYSGLGVVTGSGPTTGENLRLQCCLLLAACCLLLTASSALESRADVG